MRRTAPIAVFLFLFLGVIVSTFPAEASERPRLEIPRTEVAPELEDFVSMAASPRVAQMARVSGFTQRDPHDGEPAEFRTDVYAGYDTRRLYVAFVCFDPERAKIRTGVSRREDVGNDDRVVVRLDTFADQRRAYMFIANATGVQWDGTYAEGVGEDGSWDAVWDSRATLTNDGYVVLMSIPFKALRFPSTELQNWGVSFARVVPRLNEHSYWPPNTRGTAGQLNKSAQTTGIERVSPGRNIQVMPHGTFRNSRSLDNRDPLNVTMRSERAHFEGGVDTKFVLKDSLVLDTTISPDFSQVEADAPQVLVNNRFEVYVPEKRPFFLENTSYFETPLQLLFTRRIADPQFGARLTGKVGRFTVATLFADDQEPGKIVPEGSPLADSRATFAVARVTRDIFNESSIGMMLTNREFEGSHNRVGGADARFKLGQRWVVAGQAVASSTRFLDGSTVAGPAYHARANYQSRNLVLQTVGSYVSPGFWTDTGFMPQVDVARLNQTVQYVRRPKNKFLLSWGPYLDYQTGWDSTGLNIERSAYTEMMFNFKRETRLNLNWTKSWERLRPQDFPALGPLPREYGYHQLGAHFDLGVWRKFQLCTRWNWESRINYVTLRGHAPELAAANYQRTIGIFRPKKNVSTSVEHIWLRLREPETQASVFNNHIFRSRTNYQFSRELSVRFIADYNTVLANPLRTRLATDKKFNADFLVTYLLHPGTAIYAGYNTNLRNRKLNDEGRLLADTHFMNDGRQLFVKVSYLFQM